MNLLIGLISYILCVTFSAANDTFNDTFYDVSGPYFVSREAVNWTQARDNCRDAGLELVSVISEEEQDHLVKFIKMNEILPKDVWSGYWLSGIRHDDGRYYWDSTETEIDSKFRGWCWGEPSHAYDREDCVELKWDGVKLGWNDYFCDELRRYICEKRREFTPKLMENNLQQKQMLEWLQKIVQTADVEPFNVDLLAKENSKENMIDSVVLYPENNKETEILTDTENKEGIALTTKVE